MRRPHAVIALACFGLLCCACEPVPSLERGGAAVPRIEVEPSALPSEGEVPGEASSTAAEPTGSSDAGAVRRESRSCRCDVLDFESDGPPRGSCTLVFGADGSATLTGVTSTPAFSAHLVPLAGRKKRTTSYVFDGEFDFKCDEAWCGHQRLSVLAVAEFDYRVTVARTPEGPPSHVLWVTCQSG